MAGKAANSVLLTSKNLMKHMTASLEISLNEANAILDRLKDGKSAPKHIIQIALSITEALPIEAIKAADEGAVSIGHGCN
jgi:hypothetical protein